MLYSSGVCRAPSCVRPPLPVTFCVFFFNDRPPPELYPLSLHDALPISEREQLLERVLGDLPRRDHQPERARLLELVAQLGERRGGARLDTGVERLHVVA